MQKTILITGATDGIGFETAKELALLGHKILLHGRNEQKLQESKASLVSHSKNEKIETYLADLSDMHAIEKLASEIQKRHKNIDVLINNAGVYKTSTPLSLDGLDVRFLVNAIAPYYLTKLLSPLFTPKTRIINLSSAAQAPLDIDALKGKHQLSSSQAYAQSKLAISMITLFQAEAFKERDISFVSLNPASLLGSKMVKEGYGIEGKDLRIGSDILVRLSLDEKFSHLKGEYFDNDIAAFSKIHPFGELKQNQEELVEVIEQILSTITQK